MEMNEVTVLFFATFKDLTGVKKIDVELEQGAKVADLKTQLILKYPGLEAGMSSVLVSVNREFAFDEDSIPEKAEVALFPPVSGGGVEDQPTIFEITSGRPDLNAILGQITTPRTGAACYFAGMVRGVTTRGEIHETSYLEYEAYQPMAEDKMKQVAMEIRERWPSVEGLAIVQRIGRLDPGSPTVLIACSAAHRDTGVFEAARYGIDRLKEIVPVWKKEVSHGGEMWVEGGYQPGEND